MSNIGAAVHQVRSARRITQQHLADLSGVNESFISLLENGKRNPTWSTLTKIANALGVNVTVLSIIAESQDPAIAPFVPLIYRFVWEKEPVR